MNTVFTKSGLENCRALTLTATVQAAQAGWPFQAASWAHAVCRTHCPRGSINPVSSARGMKRAGDTRPWVAWFQRTSASTPVVTICPGAWACTWIW